MECIVDRDDVETTTKENDSQDSDKEEPTRKGRKKAYNCSKCGKPLKGHICSVRHEIVAMYKDKEQPTKRRIYNDDDTKMKNLSTIARVKVDPLHSGSDDESSSGTTSTPQKSINTPRGNNRNWFDDADDDDNEEHEDTTRRIVPKKRFIQHLDDSTEDEKCEPTLLSTSSKRAYACRMCGVPRKGHICQYVNSNGLLSTVIAKESTYKRNINASNKKRRRHASEILTKVFLEDSDDTDSNQGSDIPWTDLLIPAHILMEEVDSYIKKQQRIADSRTKKNIDIEQQNLQIWSADVYKEFLKLNEHAFKEMEQISNTKRIQHEIYKARDTIITLRSKINRLRIDRKNLHEHIIVQQNKQIKNIAASKFLSAIDALR